MHSKKAGTFLSRVTLGHMQLRTAYACQRACSPRLGRRRVHMRATNLKFETRYSKLATNLKFGIQICLVSKLFLCACASGNNANPELVAKLLPSLCDCRGICLWFAGFYGYDGICVWIRARHMNFSCPTVTLGHMNKSTAYEFPSLVYMLMMGFGRVWFA